MGHPGGRRGSCGTVGPRASGQRATAIAYHGPLTEVGRTPCGLLGALERERGGVASVMGSPPLLPIPGPTACVRACGCLAPRGSVMPEPPRAAGGRRAEGWAHEY